MVGPDGYRRRIENSTADTNRGLDPTADLRIASNLTHATTDWGSGGEARRAGCEGCTPTKHAEHEKRLMLSMSMSRQAWS